MLHCSYRPDTAPSTSNHRRAACSLPVLSSTMLQCSHAQSTNLRIVATAFCLFNQSYCKYPRARSFAQSIVYKPDHRGYFAASTLLASFTSSSAKPNTFWMLGGSVEPPISSMILSHACSVIDRYCSSRAAVSYHGNVLEIRKGGIALFLEKS